jgi:hypothetical protein
MGVPAYNAVTIVMSAQKLNVLHAHLRHYWMAETVLIFVRQVNIVTGPNVLAVETFVYHAPRINVKLVQEIPLNLGNNV